jgi:hypothetical protein
MPLFGSTASSVGRNGDSLKPGGTSAGLDINLYPKQYMEGGSITLAQGVGGQKATFPNAMNAGDNVALLASRGNARGTA